jgi:hypothetical protein
MPKYEGKDIVSCPGIALQLFSKSYEKKAQKSITDSP